MSGLDSTPPDGVRQDDISEKSVVGNGNYETEMLELRRREVVAVERAAVAAEMNAELLRDDVMLRHFGILEHGPAVRLLRRKREVFAENDIAGRRVGNKGIVYTREQIAELYEETKPKVRKK